MADDVTTKALIEGCVFPRLRGAGRRGETMSCCQVCPKCTQAVLREVIDRAEGQLALAAKDAEIERLREALDRISRMSCGCNDIAHPDGRCTAKRARAALAGKE